MANMGGLGQEVAALSSIQGPSQRTSPRLHVRGSSRRPAYQDNDYRYMTKSQVGPTPGGRVGARFDGRVRLEKCVVGVRHAPAVAWLGVPRVAKAPRRRRSSRWCTARDGRPVGFLGRCERAGSTIGVRLRHLLWAPITDAVPSSTRASAGSLWEVVRHCDSRSHQRSQRRDPRFAPPRTHARLCLHSAPRGR